MALGVSGSEAGLGLDVVYKFFTISDGYPLLLRALVTCLFSTSSVRVRCVDPVCSGKEGAGHHDLEHQGQYVSESIHPSPHLRFGLATTQHPVAG